MKRTVFASLLLLHACGADAGAGRPASSAPKRPRSSLEKRQLDELIRMQETASRCSGAPAGFATSTAPDVEETGGGEAARLDVEQPLYLEIPVEDRSGRALARFYQALERAGLGSGQARLVIYGASHVASDLFTNVVRQRLQLEFGEAGAGFVLPAKPWRWYRHSGIDIERSVGWRALRVRARAPKEDFYGFAGVALESRADRRAVGAIATRPNGELSGQASIFELYYLKQPGGGRLLVFIDGERVGSIPTASEAHQAGYQLFRVPEGHHRFEIRAIGNGPVRVFGVAIERETPGVILDTVGIPGARARYHLMWNDALYREHLARRRPDLVALAYGTNESGDDDVPLEFYEKTLREVMDRIRETVPEASCLLIGPSDRPRKLEQAETSERDAEQNGEGSGEPYGAAGAGQDARRGDAADAGRESEPRAAADAGGPRWPDDEWYAEQGYGPRPLTAEIIAVQRRVARDYGCGFFDLVRFMGGHMSMVRWAAASPPLGAADHVHFTLAGYQLLGNVLFRSLMAGYQTPQQ